MNSNIEQLKQLSIHIPAAERDIENLRLSTDGLREAMKNQESVHVLAGLDGKNEKERAAQLAQKLLADWAYQEAKATVEKAEKEMLDARQQLSVDTHMWRVLDLSIQLEIADRRVMVGELIRPER